jgi:hypothetical protein
MLQIKHRSRQKMEFGRVKSARTPRSVHIDVCAVSGDTPGMYSEAVLDHFQSPRNAGTMDAATATISVENPVCGDILELSARVEGGRIVEARFRTRGCEQMSEALGGLPPATFHAAQLARDAAHALAAKLK